MTPSGIEPATFWLVAQSLNQLPLRGDRKASYELLTLVLIRIKLTIYCLLTVITVVFMLASV